MRCDTMGTARQFPKEMSHSLRPSVPFGNGLSAYPLYYCTNCERRERERVKPHERTAVHTVYCRCSRTVVELGWPEPQH